MEPLFSFFKLAGHSMREHRLIFDAAPKTEGPKPAEQPEAATTKPTEGPKSLDKPDAKAAATAAGERVKGADKNLGAQAARVEQVQALKSGKAETGKSTPPTATEQPVTVTKPKEAGQPKDATAIEGKLTPEGGLKNLPVLSSRLWDRKKAGKNRMAPPKPRSSVWINDSMK